jgi:hypothetical protein
MNGTLFHDSCAAFTFFGARRILYRQQKNIGRGKSQLFAGKYSARSRMA